jgi:hypothetical protein
VQEIFAVAAIGGSVFPDLINDDLDLMAGSYVLPNEALREVPPELRAG